MLRPKPRPRRQDTVRPPPPPRIGPSRRARATLAACVLAGAATSVAPSRPAAAAGDWPPRVNLGDGAFTLKPVGLLQIDAGATFAHTRPDGPRGGVNARRARLGVEGDVLDDFGYTATWDFGGTPGSRNRLYEAYAYYRGPGPLTLTGGVFEPDFSLQQQTSAKDLLFLERTAISDAAAGVAGNSRRLGAKAMAHGERWFISAALTGGRVGYGGDSSQRGAVVRLAGRPVRTEDLSVHLGFSGNWSFRPARGEGGRRGVSFSSSSPGELALDRRNTPLDTGSIAADDARTGGLEFGLSWRRLQAQAEAYWIGVDRPGPRGDTLVFSGWYVQASYTLFGEPREYKPNIASWKAPDPGKDGFDPAEGRWGALEIGARVSTLDLNERDVRGGRQRVWAAGLGWWPADKFGAFLQWQHARIVDGPTGSRGFQTLALRVVAGF